MKKLIAFDLDGTLAESKAPIDKEMAGLLHGLLGVARVAVISGGNWPQFQQQVVGKLPQDGRLKNLSILPTCGAKFYQFGSDWTQLYSEDFTAPEKQKIIGALKKVSELSEFKVDKTWGDQIEDRGSQVTFSALGQKAPIDQKEKWDPDFGKRKKMKTLIDKMIPEFSVRLGGTTSIDVTQPGVDKAYGIRKLRDALGISIEEMIFIGDAIFPGGNDYAAKQTGVVTIEVKNPEETKRTVQAIVACLEPMPCKNSQENS